MKITITLLLIICNIICKCQQGGGTIYLDSESGLTGTIRLNKPHLDTIPVECVYYNNALIKYTVPSHWQATDINPVNLSQPHAYMPYSKIDTFVWQHPDSTYDYSVKWGHFYDVIEKTSNYCTKCWPDTRHLYFLGADKKRLPDNIRIIKTF